MLETTCQYQHKVNVWFKTLAKTKHSRGLLRKATVKSALLMHFLMSQRSE